METINKDASPIRIMTRGTYDLQAVRIQMGNRITGNFKAKLGQKPGMSEEDMEKWQKDVIEKLRDSYKRITDGIVDEGGKLPSPKKFVGDELISTYTELVLVDSYMGILSNEEKQFSQLGKLLKEERIYTEFLSDIDGIGPSMAGVIVSEIDIRRAEYPSSLAKYAGLDAVTIGKYTDDAGKEHVLPADKIEAFYAVNEKGITMLAEDKYPVTIMSVGRSRKDFCLVKKEYRAANGEMKMRNSITYNPFLKTKLIGVLAGSFLKSGGYTVNDKRIGATKRYKLAIELGFETKEKKPKVIAEEVITFLKKNGYVVERVAHIYGKHYYDYKHRLENSPHHKEKTDGHRHAMALRYMVKLFLYDLYAKWRAIEGLPVAVPYAEGKLGLIHGVATVEKERK